MKKFFGKYVWAFEFAGAAILLAFGIVMKTIPISLLYIVGTIFIIMGVFRIIPLVKTTKDKLSKWLFIIEIVLNIAAGGYLIYVGTKGSASLGTVFGYMIGIVFYLRALIYFFTTIVRKEATDNIMFITHVVLITVGSMIIGSGGFNINVLSWFLLVLAILSALLIAFRGYGDYRNYRFQLSISEATKRITKEEGLEAPTKDEISEIGEINEKHPHKEKEEEINA
ncbi:MAG TPA: hypothetical protein VJZ51_03890 [Bacilli bacterium]|nr:hypothetical protein [Bacilli bacterium]